MKQTHLRHIAKLTLHLKLTTKLVAAAIALATAGGSWAQTAPRLTAARDLQNRWEYDPDLGTVWVSDEVLEQSAIDVESLQSDDLQERVESMQMAIRTVAGADAATREKAFSTVLSTLQRDLQQNARRYVLLTSVSAAAALANDIGQIESVWKLVADQPVLQKIVEPYLLQWESPIAVDVWRQRLNEGTAEFSSQLTALDGLRLLGSESDRQVLAGLVGRAETPGPMRLQASKALGALASSGLEELAKQMLDADNELSYQIAANLLRNHSSPKAIELSKIILDQGDAFAKALAFQAVATADLAQALDLAEELIDHPDDKLRLAAVNVLSRAEDEASLNVQVGALDDVNLRVRQAVRNNLREKSSKAELSNLVQQAVSQFLAGEAWQGIEQAILLAVELELDERATTIVSLVDHPKPEVNIRAAWALQHLHLDSASLDEIVARCQVTTQKLVGMKFVSFEEEIKTAFLFEAIGIHEYQEASDMLRKYIPKNQQIMKPVTRTSAIFALGCIWADQENPSLADALAGRMMDSNPLEPELMSVRYTAAIALGKMGATSQLETVKRIREEPPNPLGVAKGWVVEQLGGQ